MVTTNTLLLGLGVIFASPLLWLILASVDGSAGPAIKLPDWTLSNYAGLLSWARLSPLYNSLVIALSAAVVVMVLAMLASYGVSRHNVPFKRSFMMAILFSSALPIPMIVIPVYQIYVSLDLINSRFTTALFIAASSLPFAIWIVKTYLDHIPREFEEAAAIDGAARWQVLGYIVLPLAVPSLLVAGLLTFVNGWNAFLIPLVLDSNPDHTPGSIAIYQFMGENAAVRFGDLCAYSVLYSLPVVIIYLAISRWTSGAFALGGGLRG